MDKLGYSMYNSNSDYNYYYVKVSIDGGKVFTKTHQKFTYYKEAQVLSTVPNSGPINGGTTVAVEVQGLTQPGLCGIYPRFSTFELHQTSASNSTHLVVQTPSVDYPGSVVVTATFNDQQFMNEKVTHQRSIESTYDYYVNPVPTFHYPYIGYVTGNTKISIRGYGFKPFTPLYGQKTHPKNRMWARFVDPSSLVPLAPATEIKPENLQNELAYWYTPPQPVGTKGLLQISLNNHDFVNVKKPGSSYSFEYYNSPHITSLTPSFGPVKSMNTTYMIIEGTDFACPDNNCTDLTVRFGPDKSHQAIYESAERISATQIRVKIPQYTRPDVLQVEVAMDGQQYTSDHKTYGYYDPYVLNAYPRLIALDGSTQITIKGIGFVNSG